MSGTLHYRLVIRDPADTFDALILSSHPDDDNPFLTAPPSGDGESLDPLTGKVAFAEYVLKAADEVGTLTTASDAADEMWDYADSAARNAVWPVTQSNATGSTSGGFGGDPLSMTIDYGGGIGGGSGFVKFTRTITGTPGASFVVTCEEMTLSRAASEFNDNCGMGVNGATGHVPASELSGPVSVAGTFDGSGEATIVLGHFDLEFGMTPMTLTFGNLSWSTLSATTTARVITGLLADADGKWAGVNRKASWYESTDDGATWMLVYAGWLTQAILTGGIEWTLHVGDSDRRERQITAFTSLPSATGFSGQRLIGTPFAPSDNVAAHYPPAWRFKVEKTSDTDDGLADAGPDYVQLDFQSGWMPDHPDEDIVFREGSIHDDVVAWIIRASRPFIADDLGVGFAALKGLTATVTTTAGVVLSGYTPVAGRSFLTTSIIAFNDRIWMRKSGALPTVGTLLDVIVAIDGVSDQSPVWWQGHPVDLVAGLLTEAGLAYDASSAATVKAALGPLYAQYRFTKTEALWALIERVAFGPCGFALRRNTAWEWEFFETRTIPASEPSETIDESAMYDPERAIFDLGVDSQVTAVVWKLVNWVIGSATGDDPPLDRAQAQTVTATYVGESGDDVTYGEHQVVYDLPGTIVLLDGQAPAPTANIYHQTQSEIILTRWGRGVPSSEIATLRASGIAALLGEFVVVDLDHKPTVDLTATPPGVRGGARICQVVHRTRDPAGPVLQLLDVGTATTNALVPAFTLAQGTDTRHASTLTLTNSGSLTGYQVEVQVNTGASEPTGGTSLPLFAPDAVAHDLPAQLAGSTVWARARVVSGDELPGAWSDWDSVALDAVPPVTGLSNAAGANDTERVLTWTVGDATLPVRVRWKATADASYLHSITLPAGSNTYTITGIVTGTAMTAAVDHVEVSPFTGDSSDATTTWTAGSTVPTLTAPTNPQGFTDGNGTYGLRVTASVLPSRVVFMQAVETSVGSGTYGTPVEVGSITSVAGAGACVITLTRANDGLRVQLTSHHAKTGYTDSGDTTAVTLSPWETTATPPGEASDAAYVVTGAVPASLPNARQLAGESGVVSVTDGGAGSTVTVGLVAGGVPLAKLAATGTPSGATFLRGDATWSPVAGGSSTITRRCTFTFVLPHAEAGAWQPWPVDFAATIVEVEAQNEDGTTCTATVEIERASDAGFPTFADLTGGHDVVMTADDRLVDATLTDWTTALAEGDTLRARIVTTDASSGNLLVTITTEDALTAAIAAPSTITVGKTLRVVGDKERQPVDVDATIQAAEIQGGTAAMTGTIEVWRATDGGFPTFAKIGEIVLDGSETGARRVDDVLAGFTSLALAQGDTLEFRLTAASVAGDLSGWLTLRVGDASGVGGIGGTVAVGKIPVMVGAQTAAASALSDDGTNVTSAEPLILEGGLVRPVRTVSATTTLDATDYLLIVTASATVNLPAAASHTGRAYEIVPTSGATATLDPNGSEQIDGAATLALTSGALIACDGTGWHAVAKAAGSGGGGSSWTPMGAANLHTWLRATLGVYKDAGITAAGDTETVQQWNDQSGNGHHFSQATSGARPTFRTATINGLAAVDFDGVDDGLDGVLVTAPYTIYVVYQPDAVTGLCRVLDGSSNWLIGPYSESHRLYAGAFVSSGHAPVFAGQAVVCCAVNDGNNSLFLVDGANVTTDCTPGDTPGTLNIGGTQGAFNEPFNGKVGELIVFSAVHNASQRVQVMDYLRTDWIG